MGIRKKQLRLRAPRTLKSHPWPKAKPVEKAHEAEGKKAGDPFAGSAAIPAKKKLSVVKTAMAKDQPKNKEDPPDDKPADVPHENDSDIPKRKRPSPPLAA